MSVRLNDINESAGAAAMFAVHDVVDFGGIGRQFGQLGLQPLPLRTAGREGLRAIRDDERSRRAR
jgi:hypothetical protein